MSIEQIASRLDDLPLSRRHWRVILIGSGVLTVVVPNIMIIAFVVARLLREWSLSLGQIGLVNSMAILGMLGGSLAGGYIADRFGRRPVILGSIITTCLFSALSALAWNLPTLILSRMLVGAASASAFAITPILLAEISPRRIRGRIMMFTEMGWALGATLAALDGYLVIPSLGWRVALALGSVPLLAFPVFLWAISESPRFLLIRGRESEAEEIVRSYELSAGRTPVPPSGPSDVPVNPSLPAPPSAPAFLRVFELGYRKRTLLLWIIWIAINCTYFGVFTWLPSLMIARGFGESSSFGWNVYMTAWLVPGAVMGGFLSDHWGRKSTLSAALIGNGIATFFFGLAATELTFLVWGGLFSISHQAIWVTALAYTNEMYPSEMRAQGMSYASAVGRIGSIMAPFAVGSVMGGLGAEMGYLASFSMFSLLLFSGGTAVLCLGSETKGRSLEELTA